jgi:hypothetical protein
MVAVAALFAPLGVTTAATALVAAGSTHFWFAGLFSTISILSAAIMIDDIFLKDELSARVLKALASK